MGRFQASGVALVEMIVFNVCSLQKEKQIGGKATTEVGEVQTRFYRQIELG